MQTLIKNTRAYRLLQAEGKLNAFGHAYLLQFDDGQNLRSALKTFAKIFFGCADADANAAPDKKRISELIDAETFSDCLFYPAIGEKFVVEDAERLAEECLLQPVEGEKKLFVVSDFSQATTAAQNKLLKLLEDPPESVIFLLGATTVFSVLPTVLSRVEKLEIPPFDVPQISAFLKRTYANDGKYTQTDFSLCAAACGGYPGAAQNVLEDGGFRALLADAFSLCLARQAQLPVLARKIGETKRKKEFLSLLRILFRDALILSAGLPETQLFLQGEKQKLSQMATSYGTAALLLAQEELSETERQLFFNTVFPQCLEITFAKIFKNRNQR